MALRLIKASKSIASVHFLPQVFPREWQNTGPRIGIEYYKHQSPLTYIYRYKSFFSRRTAPELWKGTVSVSNAGRKRGRAKSRRPVKNLNRGQVIGVGKINMVWPGLNSPIIRGRDLVTQRQLPENPEREKLLFQLRDSMTKRRRHKLSPLERGWSGGKLGGRSIGPPDPIGEETFEGFDSKILKYKMISIMTGNLGRQRRVRVFVVTGNHNGLAGFAQAKGSDGKSTLRLAKNRAATKLIYIPRCNENTVYHDFFCQFGASKIFVLKKGEGHGLVCHRAIKTCCELIGIKNLYAKVEGSRNLQHIIKAFFIGLLQQKTHEQLAEEKKLHLVEFKEECGNFPNVLASPTKVRKREEIPFDEVLDFRQYIMGGKIVYNKTKYPPFYTTQKSWTNRLRKIAYLRNKEDVRYRMYAEYGELRSFYTDEYPEAKPAEWKKPAKEGEEQ